MAQLRSVTCNMGSHSVTCYPTQVNTPRLNPSHAGWYSIYLPRRDGRLSWPSWLDSAPAGSWTWDLLITSPTLNQCNHQDNVLRGTSYEKLCTKRKVLRLKSNCSGLMLMSLRWDSSVLGVMSWKLCWPKENAQSEWVHGIARPMKSTPKG